MGHKIFRINMFRALLTVALVTILFFSTSSLDHSAAAGVNDKIAHALSFLILAVLSDRSFPGYQYGWKIVLPLIGYGLGIEIIQYFLPERTFSLLDLAADAAGLLAYWCYRAINPANSQSMIFPD